MQAYVYKYRGAGALRDYSEHPKDTLKEEDYSDKEIYESVVTVSCVVTGKDQEDIGTLGRRKYYYRLCCIVLFLLPVQADANEREDADNDVYEIIRVCD